MNTPWYQKMFAANRTPAVPRIETATIPDEADEQLVRGLQFSLGVGEAQNEVKAAELYRLAADRGNALAQFNLAIMYDCGQGVAQNRAEATKWFHRAAEQGDAGAQLQMGKRCHRGSFGLPGEGASESKIEAYKWFNLAAVQGYKDSETHCEQIGLVMTREELSEGQRRVARFVPDSRKV
jgi:TPR repeat protein